MAAEPLTAPVSARSPVRIAETILALAEERGSTKTICPSEVARALGGPHPDGWSPLMPLVRREAVRLMKEGRIAILRKGRIVDPDDFRGIYRIRTGGAQPDDQGAGNSASMRPDSR